LTYKLYKTEQRILPFDDYGAILESAKGCKTALEFGPGSTTLALIEAGVEQITSYEYHAKWLAEMQKRLKDYPQVTIKKFDDVPVLTMLEPVRFDIAVVDSPPGGKNSTRIVHPGQEGLSRFNTLKYAIEHADIVVMHDCDREDELNSIASLGAKYEMLSRKVARIYL
jgi:hypothetical protein